MSVFTLIQRLRPRIIDIESECEISDFLESRKTKVIEDVKVMIHRVDMSAEDSFISSTHPVKSFLHGDVILPEWPSATRLSVTPDLSGSRLRKVLFCTSINNVPFLHNREKFIALTEPRGRTPERSLRETAIWFYPGDLCFDDSPGDVDDLLRKYLTSTAFSVIAHNINREVLYLKSSLFNPIMGSRSTEVGFVFKDLLKLLKDHNIWPT